MSPRGLQARAPRRHQQGIVLFIALIVMVAMSLAGVALVRSIETTTAVVGNLAFRQAAMLPANMAVEAATAALFANASTTNAATITDKEADLATENYYARLQAGEVNGIPLQLQKKANFTLPKILYADADKYFEVRYVIERMCQPAAPLPLTTGTWINWCDVLPPKQGAGGLENKPGGNVPLDPIPFYRLTVRVDGPQNTTAFLQTMLR